MTAAYVLNLPDTTPPTITATVSPAANAAGWHRGPVTVTFVCTDAESGVAVCPDALTVTTAGAHQVFEVYATDLAQNTASATVTLHIDLAPPTLMLPVPDVLSADATSYTLVATVTDVLSGVASLTCNGQAAALEEHTASCTVDVVAGDNSIGVVAHDRAGNLTVETLTVQVMTPLVVDPVELRIGPGITAQMHARTAAGHELVGVQWSASDPQVATVSTGGVLTAVSYGVTTVTASHAGQSGTSVVTVVSDAGAPSLTIDSPLDTASTRDMTIAVVGSVHDEDTDIRSVTCNGAAATVTWGRFTCDVPLTVGANVITVTARDYGDNETTHTVSVTRNHALLAAIYAPDEMAPSSRRVISIGVLAPSHVPTSVTWHQVSGPPLQFLQHTGHELEIVAPADPGTVTLAATVTAGDLQQHVEASFAVRGLRERLGYEPTALEEHESALLVSATSLTAEGIWVPDGELRVTLAAADNRMLDTTDPERPLMVHLNADADTHDVTPLFQYDMTTNALVVGPDDATALHALAGAGAATLHIEALDSAGQVVDLTVPFFVGGGSIAGTVSSICQAPCQPRRVTAEGITFGLSRAATVQADGTFIFSDLVADSYAITVTDDAGEFGMATADVTTGIASVELPVRSVISNESEGTTCDGPTTCISRTSVPRGTRAVDLNVYVSAQNLSELLQIEVHQQGAHPCDVLRRAESQGYWMTLRDTVGSYAVLVDGRVLATGSTSFCGTHMAGETSAIAQIRPLALGELTRQGDVMVTIVQYNQVPADALAPGYGRMDAYVLEAEPGLRIRSVSDSAEVGRRALGTETTNRSTKGRRYIGVPAHLATFNTFKLAIRFEPNDAEILETRVRAEGNGGSWGALGYASQQHPGPGAVRLSNVGFAPASVMRPLYAAKTLEVRLKVEVDARLATGDVVTATGFVDRRGDEGGSERFLTLFDCGPLALPAARRYSGRDADIGGDCWGRPNALNLLSDYEFLVVNDVSTEHGGPSMNMDLIRVVLIWTYDTSATAECRIR